ncbi:MULTISPECIES: ATP-binding protein [unclassified Streptomyces]|uniref:ATP-binding protein n=1 Tax=unclassified Streptomyces TaxID=2593676 RepID=UPI00226F4E44|nr:MULTISPECIES: ATP-binding protein [unclassified Streptomyces]MCY0924154.1 ATP-binding protein [Streptomyces sp. H27-G5]MCY0962353.1 ATP-binding protein [Streptomyces sp. H27-H5]
MPHSSLSAHDWADRTTDEGSVHSVPHLDRQHLVTWFAILAERVRLSLSTRSEHSTPLLGLFPDNSSAYDRLVREPSLPAPSPREQALREIADEHVRLAAGRSPLRLVRLADSFCLSSLDVELLVIAIAPHVDQRFAQAFAHLNDDTARAGVTAHVALLLARGDPFDPGHVHRLSPSGPLLRNRLIYVEDDTTLPATRILRVSPRIYTHLLGGDDLDTISAPRISLRPPVRIPFLPSHLAAIDGIRKAHASAPAFTLLRHEDVTVATGIAHEALSHLVAGSPSVIVDLHEGPTDSTERSALLAEAILETRLRDSSLIVGPIGETDAAELVRLLGSNEPSLQPFHVVATATADVPISESLTPREVVVPPLATDERVLLWQRLLESDSAVLDGELESLARDMALYRLTATQIADTHSWASRQAEATSTPLSGDVLRTAVRRHNTPRLARLATRIVPAVDFDDLVLDSVTKGQIDALTDRIRYRDIVLDAWRLKPGNGYGRGISALFSGESGTGKTLAAEVIAGALGLDLYVINLSTIVDKYIGETEKNLEQIFTEAANVNGILLFDEADALFGKRTEVKDSHDRYSNIETSYLLQRLEKFDGIILLTTNLAANIDTAFQRRLDSHIPFAIPDAKQRTRLWQGFFKQAPIAPDLDIKRIADAFNLTGGSIRSCALAAAYAAASAGTDINNHHVLAAIRSEYRKLRKIIDPRLFADEL